MPTQEQRIQAKQFFQDIRKQIAPLAKEVHSFSTDEEKREHRAAVRDLFIDLRMVVGSAYGRHHQVIREAGRERHTQWEKATPFATRYINSTHGYYRSLAVDENKQEQGNKISAFVTTTAHELFTHHFLELPEIMNGFIKKSAPNEVQPLYQRISRRLIVLAKEQGERFSSEQLAQLTVWYAYEPLSGLVAGDMLREYFLSTEEKPEKDIYQQKRPKLPKRPPFPNTTFVLPHEIPTEEAQTLLEMFTQNTEASYKQALQQYDTQYKKILHVPNAEREKRLALRERRIRIMSAYARAAIKLLDHPEAIRTAVEIAAGRDARVLPVESSIFRDFMLCSYMLIDFLDPKQFMNPEQLPIAHEIKLLPEKRRYLELKRDTFNAKLIFNGLDRLSGVKATSDIDAEENNKRERVRQTTGDVYIEELISQGWKREWIPDGIKAVYDAAVLDLGVISYKAWKKISSAPITGFIRNPDHPLYQLYNIYLHPELAELKWRGNVSSEMQKLQIDPSRMIEVIVPFDGQEGQLHFLLPKNLRPRLTQVVTQVLTDMKIHSDELLRTEGEVSKEEIARAGVPAVWGKIVMDGEHVWYLSRDLSKIEKQRHPITALEYIGFPVLATERSLGELNNELLNMLLIEQSRLIDRRGYQVFLNNTVFGEFGYDHINFFSDRKNPEKTVVEFHFGDSHYDIMLDQFFGLDFEGKKLPSREFSELVWYTILSYLVPILCNISGRQIVRKNTKYRGDQFVEEADRQEVERATSTMGVLRKLWKLDTEGTRYAQFTEEAARHYYEDTGGRNLYQLNLERAARGLVRKTYNRPPKQSGEKKEDSESNPRIIRLSSPAYLEI